MLEAEDATAQPSRPERSNSNFQMEFLKPVENEPTLSLRIPDVEPHLSDGRDDAGQADSPSQKSPPQPPQSLLVVFQQRRLSAGTDREKKGRQQLRHRFKPLNLQSRERSRAAEEGETGSTARLRTGRRGTY